MTFENELFGHVGGAFTGARPKSEGLITEADHGTLFLDEVDSLALASQVKLRRLIQEEYRRLGESRTRQADIRLVAATNADLFLRLRIIPIEVPPPARAARGHPAAPHGLCGALCRDL